MAPRGQFDQRCTIFGWGVGFQMQRCFFARCWARSFVIRASQQRRRFGYGEVHLDTLLSCQARTGQHAEATARAMLQNHGTLFKLGLVVNQPLNRPIG